VLWEGKLFAAKGMKRHRTGEYDVVYEEDETEGTFVTRKELRPTGEEEVVGGGG
jgi:hypothetical protein